MMDSLRKHPTHEWCMWTLYAIRSGRYVRRLYVIDSPILHTISSMCNQIWTIKTGKAGVESRKQIFPNRFPGAVLLSRIIWWMDLTYWRWSLSVTAYQYLHTIFFLFQPLNIGHILSAMTAWTERIKPLHGATQDKDSCHAQTNPSKRILRRANQWGGDPRFIQLSSAWPKYNK
jgi:hypothetical protein